MFKLNAATLTIATALAVSVNAVNLGVRADEVLCRPNGSFSCRGSSNLPFPTLGEIPNFPLVIGFANTNDNTSPNCGDCYELTHVVNGETRTRFVTVGSSSDAGFINMCITEVRNLTGITGPLPDPASIRVDLVERPRSLCGL